MATRGPTFICASCTRALRRSSSSTSNLRTLSTTRPGQQSTSYSPGRVEDQPHVPRWQQTPPRMRMAFRVRPPSGQPEWKVNHDPEVLDSALDRYIGEAAGRGVTGRSLLPEEIRWLAVTHKSFEQGARGFNDRLAFLGKRIVDVEVCKALLDAPGAPIPDVNEKVDGEARIGPQQRHPALDGVENITAFAKETIISPVKVSQLASRYGLDKAVRWQPKQVERMKYSGRQGVMTGAMYAVIGAIALQKGGDVAISVAKQRILRPLGL